MVYKIAVDYEECWKDNHLEYVPVYETFTDPDKANAFIQDYLDKTSYGVVGVRSITKDTIELYFDIVQEVTL